MAGKYGASYMPPTALESLGLPPQALEERHIARNDCNGGQQRHRRRNRNKAPRHENKTADDAPEMLVFGYSCSLFRDDNRALVMEEGKHLIPWMGERDLMIDRYDARALLHEKALFDAKFASHEQPSTRVNVSWYGGDDDDVISFGKKEEVVRKPDVSDSGSDVDIEDWREDAPDDDASDVDYSVYGDDADVERQCDEERYCDLYDAEEKAMLDEEDEKRRRALEDPTAYKMVPFNYGGEAGESLGVGGMQDRSESSAAADKDTSESAEMSVPYEAPAGLSVPEDISVPLHMGEHRVIERTAALVLAHGVRMEILVKAKQARNSRFAFLDMDHPLNPYYKHVMLRMASGDYVPTAAATHGGHVQPSHAVSVDASESIAAASSALGKKPTEVDFDGEFTIFGMTVPRADARVTIDRTASHVAQNGPSFAELLREKRKGDARFAFLVEGGEHNAYFAWAVATAAEGHDVPTTLRQWFEYHREQEKESSAAEGESTAGEKAENVVATNINPLAALGVAYDSSDSDSDGEGPAPTLTENARSALALAMPAAAASAVAADASLVPTESRPNVDAATKVHVTTAPVGIDSAGGNTGEDAVLAERRRRAAEFLKKRLAVEAEASPLPTTAAPAALTKTLKAASGGDAPEQMRKSDRERHASAVRKRSRSRSSSRRPESRERSESPRHRHSRDERTSHDSRDRDRRRRSRSRSRDRQRRGAPDSLSRSRDRNRDRPRERSRERDREREKERERDRDRGKNREREKAREREGGRDGGRSRRDDSLPRKTSDTDRRRRSRSREDDESERKRSRTDSRGAPLPDVDERGARDSKKSPPVVEKREIDQSTEKGGDASARAEAAAPRKARRWDVASRGLNTNDDAHSDPPGDKSEAALRERAETDNGESKLCENQTSIREDATRGPDSSAATLPRARPATVNLGEEPVGGRNVANAQLDGSTAKAETETVRPAPIAVELPTYANPFIDNGLPPGAVPEESKQVAMDLLAKVRAAQKRKK